MNTNTFFPRFGCDWEEDVLNYCAIYLKEIELTRNDVSRHKIVCSKLKLLFYRSLQSFSHFKIFLPRHGYVTSVIGKQFNTRASVTIVS